MKSVFEELLNQVKQAPTSVLLRPAEYGEALRKNNIPYVDVHGEFYYICASNERLLEHCENFHVYDHKHVKYYFARLTWDSHSACADEELLFLVSLDRYMHTHHRNDFGAGWGWFNTALRAGQKELLVANKIPFVVTPTLVRVAISNECLNAAIDSYRSIQHYNGPLEAHYVQDLELISLYEQPPTNPAWQGEK